MVICNCLLLKEKSKKCLRSFASSTLVLSLLPHLHPIPLQTRALAGSCRRRRVNQFKTANQRFLPGAGRKIILILVFLEGSKVVPVWGMYLYNCTSLLNIYVKAEERHLRSHTKVILPTSERRDAWVRRAAVGQEVHTWVIAFVFTVYCYLRFVCWGDPVGVFCSLLGVT